MKEKLLKIINHYGLRNQLKYIHSEYFELDEAIITDENIKYIAEEIADCYVMLEQFRHYYEISDKEILAVMKQKINRQLERISEENESCDFNWKINKRS